MKSAFSRSGQTTVESMMLISVVVIALVAAFWIFFGGEHSFADALDDFGEGAATVYAEEPDLP